MKGIIAYRHVYPAVMALMQRGYFRAEDMVINAFCWRISWRGFEALLSDKAQVKIIVTLWRWFLKGERPSADGLF